MKIIKRLSSVKKYLALRNDLYVLYPFLSKRFKFEVLTNEQTLDKILSERPCVSRFGDGELELMQKRSIGFQKANAVLAERLEEIVKSVCDGMLICMTDIMLRNKGFVKPTALYHAGYVVNNYTKLKKIIPENRVYGCTNFTRFYADYKNKSRDIMQRKIDKIRSIWTGYNVYVIEGEFTRSGVGNNLFYNALSVRRIVCPAVDAFNRYKDIFESITELIPKDDNNIILCFLGPTATVLAYDLYKSGYYAMDMGHIDIEYEWFIRGTLWKADVDGKAVNERSGNFPDNPITTSEYEQQILRRII